MSAFLEQLAIGDDDTYRLALFINLKEALDNKF